MEQEPPATNDKFEQWAPLTGQELEKLTFFKWRYTLISGGFDKREVSALSFLAWRVATYRCEPARDLDIDSTNSQVDKRFIVDEQIALLVNNF